MVYTLVKRTLTHTHTMASTSSTPTRPETQKLPMSKQVLEKMTTLGMSVEDIILMTKSDPPTKVKKFLIGQGIVSSVANSHVLYAKLREYSTYLLPLYSVLTYL